MLAKRARKGPMIAAACAAPILALSAGTGASSAADHPSSTPPVSVPSVASLLPSCDQPPCPPSMEQPGDSSGSDQGNTSGSNEGNGSYSHSGSHHFSNWGSHIRNNDEFGNNSESANHNRIRIRIHNNNNVAVAHNEQRQHSLNYNQP
ncbi:hypothetical protein [Streptomyces sp. NPDC059468]|uniref:hypothetical protein n=1 Tax=Streptomyces sp. NPDC059468 TaxID=3346845 RepID=UPI00367FF6E1